jgi:spermidine/putrescine transport system substrate-binding protein
MNENTPMDPALVRGLTQRRFDRRDVMKMFGVGAAGLAAAACGVKGAKKAPIKADAVAEFWKGKTGKGHVEFANWQNYMQPDHAPLNQFTKETSVTVKYSEVITEDPAWYGKIQPVLAAGQSIGYDLMVVTNGPELTKLIELGYLVPLDHSKMPNFNQYADPVYKNESYDPGNVYSVPYVTGYTGIAYNTKYVKEPITNWAQLFDPKSPYKGKIGMMGDVQEIGNVGMFMNGIDPEKSTPADWAKAAATLKAQKDAGLVRKYYAQEYVQAMESGDIWISMAWSGDMFQENIVNGKDNFKFVVPKEGGTIWTDNMMIPQHASNPVDAIRLMDYFYRPDVAAKMAEFINYVTPVPSAKDYIAKDATAATKPEDKAKFQAMTSSSLIFPTAQDYANLKHYRALKSSEEASYRQVFQPIVNG